MKRFMTSDELARDDRFRRTPIPIDFLLAEEVTADQIEEFGRTFLANDETRAVIDAKKRPGRSLFKRVDPQGDHAELFARSQMHGILIGEMQALEGAGRSCWDFADDDEIPWAFHLDMARQCWDEARHTEIYGALLDHVGGAIGEFPENVMLFEFACSDDPAERVVGVNRCLEGLALDVFNDTIRFGRAAGDETIWRSIDYVAADEVTHVRFGQVWSKALTADDPERRRKVVDFQRKVDRAFSFGGLRGAYDPASTEAFLPIARELRRLAGFSDEEIDEVASAAPRVSG